MRRLEVDYDAARQRGEIRSNGERSFSAPEKMSGAELISPKAIHEAQQLRDAEVIFLTPCG
ncbi:hypothetical protein GOFOIKOB_5624 [Methylobacterium tardum]|uniref:Uncharacterized protein n=1 Tax=Methylobacterium tardum TaxID=374432 RepID=A0AA37TLZ4_9HYPH|nr:hypothetical protein [Methylobacterium tardum]URD35224.1 hypothetical protein M6G65_22220 [Methylobacterium tardum]GJE52551.1 hypothetical protein GOFOIKOB_5624 [Methylobacterium tardum]GLS73778.1 hypothetical protein GCM10007890_57930 [Methylobacterium tardum]